MSKVDISLLYGFVGGSLTVSNGFICGSFDLTEKDICDILFLEEDELTLSKNIKLGKDCIEIGITSTQPRNIKIQNLAPDYLQNIVQYVRKRFRDSIPNMFLTKNFDLSYDDIEEIFFCVVHRYNALWPENVIYCDKKIMISKTATDKKLMIKNISARGFITSTLDKIFAPCS